MNAEVIIVGGGIIGCAAAYNLAKNGVSVLVLEGSENIGNGGSTRNGGGVRQSGRDPRELPLVMYAIQHIWPQLSDMLDTNVEYYQEGIFVWAAHRSIRKFWKDWQTVPQPAV